MAVEKVQVVNLSIASPKNEVLQTAVRAVARTGQVLVAAAGNGGPKAKPFFPAAYTNVIAVTAVDSKLKAYQHANRGGYIDFSAPGVDLWTASNNGRGVFKVVHHLPRHSLPASFHSIWRPVPSLFPIFCGKASSVMRSTLASPARIKHLAGARTRTAKMLTFHRFDRVSASTQA